MSGEPADDREQLESLYTALGEKGVLDAQAETALTATVETHDEDGRLIELELRVD